MNATQPVRPRKVTIAGGGIAAMEAVLALRALADGIEIELLAPRAAFEYPPLAVLGPFSIAEVPEVSLARFAEEQRVIVHRDTLVAVEPAAHTLVTGKGRQLEYDLLMVAAGAHAVDAVPGAIPFRGHGDERRLALLLQEYEAGDLQRLAFVVPSSSVWSLPIYELALLSAGQLAALGRQHVDLDLVTTEPCPLGVFGPRASEAMAKRLKQASIAVHTSTHARRFERGVLETVPAGEIRTDRVVALPRLRGPRLAGLPSDEDGFIPVDHHCRVEGVADVYAAGDVTSFPIKQGGIACQQADAAAEAITAAVGGDLEPEPFRPVLRGLLLSGQDAQYMQADLAGGAGEAQGPRPAMWAPAGKVFGRYLLPYLGGDRSPLWPMPAEGEGAIPVELNLAAAFPTDTAR